MQFTTESGVPPLRGFDGLSAYSAPSIIWKPWYYTVAYGLGSTAFQQQMDRLYDLILRVERLPNFAQVKTDPRFIEASKRLTIEADQTPVTASPWHFFTSAKSNPTNAQQDAQFAEQIATLNAGLEGVLSENGKPPPKTIPAPNPQMSLPFTLTQPTTLGTIQLVALAGVVIAGAYTLGPLIRGLTSGNTRSVAGYSRRRRRRR